MPRTVYDVITCIVESISTQNCQVSPSFQHSLLCGGRLSLFYNRFCALQMRRKVDWPRRGCLWSDHQGVFAIPGTCRVVHNLCTTRLYALEPNWKKCLIYRLRYSSATSNFDGMVRPTSVACMHFYHFYRDKEIDAFPNEKTVFKFRHPHVIGPESHANITPVNQWNESMKFIEYDDFPSNNLCPNRKHKGDLVSFLYETRVFIITLKWINKYIKRKIHDCLKHVRFVPEENTILPLIP